MFRTSHQRLQSLQHFSEFEHTRLHGTHNVHNSSYHSDCDGLFGYIVLEVNNQVATTVSCTPNHEYAWWVCLPMAVMQLLMHSKFIDSSLVTLSYRAPGQEPCMEQVLKTRHVQMFRHHCYAYTVQCIVEIKVHTYVGTVNYCELTVLQHHNIQK